MSMSDEWSVYKLSFPNGKLYFGISSELAKRLRAHKNSHGNKNGRRVVSDAITKYGWESVVVEVVECGLVSEDAYRIEQELIAKYGTQDFSKGYNIASGGRTNKGYKHPNPWMKGKPLSDEHKRKLKAAAARGDDPEKLKRCSDAGTKFAVRAVNLVTGYSAEFKNARVCGEKLSIPFNTIYNHIRRGSSRLGNTWQIRYL